MENIQNLLNQVAVISKKNAEILDASGSRFNMFRICGVNHYETTHSAIIAEFLNPNGSHGLKSEFLECFIKMDFNDNDVLKQDFDYITTRVITEHDTGNGRIDIVIKDEKGHAIIIENKIFAGDQCKQLKRYNIFAEGKFCKENYQIFYLTLWGNEASEQSGQGVVYTCISYHTHMIKWLEKCVCIAARFPIVRETIIQYINHLKSLTNQNMDTRNKKEIMQLLCKSENVESVFSILDALGYTFSDISNHLVNKIFSSQFSSLCHKLKLKIVSVDKIRENYDWKGFVIRHPEWNYFEIHIKFEKGLNNLCVCINPYNRTDSKKIDIDKLFEKAEIIYKRMEQNMYDYEKWKNDNIAGVGYLFPDEYTSWDNKNAMTAILDGGMIKIFEEEIEKLLELTKDLDM